MFVVGRLGFPNKRRLLLFEMAQQKYISIVVNFRKRDSLAQQKVFISILKTTSDNYATIGNLNKKVPLALLRQ